MAYKMGSSKVRELILYFENKFNERLEQDEYQRVGKILSPDQEDELISKIIALIKYDFSDKFHIKKEGEVKDFKATLDDIIGNGVYDEQRKRTN